VQGVFKGNWNPGYGFAAFALVYLARLSPLALIPAAAFLATLTIGGELAARPAGIPNSFVQILEGLMLICLAVAASGERWYRRTHQPSEPSTLPIKDPPTATATEPAGATAP
jgi:ABC-type uncharacterized transport system permease subunit